MKYWNCYDCNFTCNFTTDAEKEFFRNHIEKGHKVGKI